MDSGHIGLIILASLIVLAGYSLHKLTKYLDKRGYQRLLRGNLREDYARNNPTHVRSGKIRCACGGKKIVLRNIGPRQVSEVVREHVCHECGARLFLSASGPYLEGIVRELRQEAGYSESVQELAPSR